MKQVCEKIEKWIRERTNEAGAKGCVVGMSGGVDSSVVAVLVKRALANRMLGLILPCDSDPKDREHALMVAERFGIRTREVDLTGVYHMLVGMLPRADVRTRGNLKARLRMLILYYFANKNRYLVLGTGNRSELLLGYFTKYGDGGVDLLPLGGLYKTQVIELAKYLNIPKEIIEKEPSAGLYPKQTDRRELGFSYEKLDKILQDIERKEMFYSDVKDFLRLKEMIKKSEHKRRVPEICKV